MRPSLFPSLCAGSVNVIVGGVLATTVNIASLTSWSAVYSLLAVPVAAKWGISAALVTINLATTTSGGVTTNT